MSAGGYLKRFRERLIQRGDAYACHYCGIPFVPHGVPEGTQPYYTSTIRPNYWLVDKQGVRHPRYVVNPEYCDTPTVDHVIPRKRGGKNTLDNLVFACMSCNCSKNARDLEVFMQGIAS